MEEKENKPSWGKESENKSGLGFMNARATKESRGLYVGVPI